MHLLKSIIPVRIEAAGPVVGAKQIWAAISYSGVGQATNLQTVVSRFPNIMTHLP